MPRVFKVSRMGVAEADSVKAPPELLSSNHRGRRRVPISLTEGETLPGRLSSAVSESEMPGHRATSTRYELVRAILTKNWILVRLKRNSQHQSVDAINVVLDGVVVGKIAVGVATDVQGFLNSEFRLDQRFNDGIAHTITFDDAETGLTLNAGLSGGLSFHRMVRGQIDSVDAGILTGWGIDPRQLEGNQKYQLYDRDRFIMDMEPILREDVNRIYGSVGRHGFSVPLPAKLFDGQVHDLRVYCGDEELTWRNGPRALLKLEASEIAKDGRRYNGRVTDMSISGVRGYVVDRAADQPVTLEVFVDEELIATVVADRYVPNLKTARQSGFHGFFVAFPSRLMSGRSRVITVVVAQTRYVLPSSGNNVLFPLVRLTPESSDREDGRSFDGRLDAVFDRLELAPPRRPILPEASGRPMLSLLVLNWNGGFVLEQFLASLSRTPLRDSFEVLIVDHGSTDESVNIIESYARSLPIHHLPRRVNYSFSSSNNVAAKAARGEYLVIINNDIIFTQDCLAPLRDVLDADASVGVVGLELYEPRYQGEDRFALAVHHRGIEFQTLRGDKANERLYTPVEIEGDGASADNGLVEVPAVTAALMMVRRADYEAIGGLDEGYNYGLEDVDFCLRVARQLGKRSVCHLGVSAIHNRSATRERKFTTSAPLKQHLYTARNVNRNRDLFQSCFGSALPRKILSELLRGRSIWRRTPLRITIAVTDTDINTSAGDYFTALEFGLALEENFGFETMIVHNTQHDLADTDVFVAMRHDYDLANIRNANPGFVAAAWIRNRVDEWVASPNLEAFQLIFCSSQKAIDTVSSATGRVAHLLPIATNARRFMRGKMRDDYKADVAFTGNYWGVQREAVDLLQPQNLPYSFAIWGADWEKQSTWAPYGRGKVPYYDMPDVYASSKIVIDDSHPVTRDWNSLNSRVFDVLGAGRLVLTNCVGGVNELFGGRIPTFSTTEELQALIKKYMSSPGLREELAADLHREVLEYHTYDARARTFTERLCSFLTGLRIAIKVPVPRDQEKELWGDYHFAVGLKEALQRLGHHVRIDLLPQWYQATGVSDEVNIVLRGLSRFAPQSNTVNILWLLSHPDQTTLAEVEQYSHVCIASQKMVDRLAPRFGPRISFLPQCTDGDRFKPAAAAKGTSHEVLFVGNTRGEERPMVRRAVMEGIHGLKVFGQGWRGVVPEECFGAEQIDNAELHRFYANAGVVLNDHWPDMASEGFISNRLFDVAACGGTVISDRVPGIEDLFGDLVVQCDERESLSETIAAVLADKAGRKRRSIKLRKLIRDAHTFDHRARRIVELIGELRQ